METTEQRQERISRLESQRESRRAETIGSTEPTGPTEIAPGRGDLNRTSVPFAPMYTLPTPHVGSWGSQIWTVDGRQISFARIFAEQSWVAAAVMRMLTWAVRVPLKVYRRTGDDSRERLRPEDHQLAHGIQYPWEGGYPAALTMAFLGPLLVHGNSLTGIDEGRSGRIQFVPEDWQFLTPIYSSRNVVGGWEVAADYLLGESRGRTVSADQVIHAAWWSPLGPTGVSPLRQLGTTISIEDAATRYQRAIFKNGARPPSAIQATTEFLGLPGPVRDELLKNLREDVTTLYSGPDNGGKPALLPPGLEWNPIGHTAVEAELIDQRLIDREEIAAVYQIPPPMLGDLRRATFANIVELRQVAYTDGLGPPLVLIEQVLTARWAALSGETDVFVEFDFAGVLRGDFLKEVNALRLAIGSGLLKPNEGRAVLNRERVDDARADQLWMPWNNLQPMGEGPPKPNRAARRQQPPPQQPAAGLIVAENWRSHVERERLEEQVNADPAEEPEPNAEEAPV